MKETLEYKILKYLSKNDNGKFIKVSNLNEDKFLLISKIENLTKDNLIDSKNTYIRIKVGNINSSSEIQIPVCKIQFKGIEYLKNIDKKIKSNITNNFNSSAIGQLNQESTFSESPISIKTNDIPSKKPETKSRLKKLLSNPWVIGISLALVTTVLNGKRVMIYINDILDNI